MAHLSDNGLYTIEYGSSAWRSILNDNISKTITETKLNNGITTNINLTGDISQTGNYNLTGSLLVTNVATHKDDVQFTDSAKGVILADRSDGNNYRVYVDNGTLSVEKI